MKDFVVCIIVLCLAASRLSADDVDHPVSYLDGFDVSQGTEIISSTPVIPGFSARDLFGDHAGVGPGEETQGNTIFSDTRPPNDTDIVVFRTGKHIRLKGYRLIVSSGLFLRPTDKFSIYYSPNEDFNFQLLNSITINQLNPSTTPSQLISETADTNQIFEPVLGRLFKIEIVRPVWSVPFSGPRVVELDAITVDNTSLPATTLSAPADNSTYEVGQPVTLHASSTDSDGIRQVNFYANGQRIGASAQGPDYEFTWENPTPGDITLTASGVDMLDDEGPPSFPVVIHVKSPELRLEEFTLTAARASFKIKGTVPGTTYYVYRSADLKTWEMLQSITSTSDQETAQDEFAGTPVARFYRVSDGL